MNDKRADVGALTGDKQIILPARGGSPPVDGEEPKMILQPDTSPMSHEQLAIEMKAIYAGLVMVENECMVIDEQQSAAAKEKDLSKKIPLKNDQWQSLIALHKQLLHEHHDFLLASQHPSASPALCRLAAKYSMPARMWRHGIHAFLDVLRHRLPDSLEHMLAFIYIAYTMMALLYETVSAFEDTWIECLGDLGRYRMALEHDEPKDREVWSNAARTWYNKAVDKNSTAGRLYHHLAVLARPYSLEQLSLYSRSLTCITPFESARETIMTLFKPILQGKDTGHRQPPSFETVFIRIHGILFTSRPSDSPARFDKALEELENGVLLDDYMKDLSKDLSKDPSRLKTMGAYVAISNIAALFEYGTQSRLCQAYKNAQTVKKPTESNLDDSGNPPSSMGSSDSKVDNIDLSESEASATFISDASRLASAILAIFLKRTQDKNVYPLLHVYLTFIWSLVIVQQAWSPVVNETFWKIIEKDIPWVAVCSFLNTLLVELTRVWAKDFPKPDEFEAKRAKVWAEDFPKLEKGVARPLAEDFIMRGQLYTRSYFPHKWFTEPVIDDDERILDPPSMVRARMERLLWLGIRIASADRWIRFNKETQSFKITDHVKEILIPDAKLQPESNNHDRTMLDVAGPGSDVDSRPDEAHCLTPGTANRMMTGAPSTGGSKTGQNEARTAEFVQKIVGQPEATEPTDDSDIYTTGGEDSDYEEFPGTL